MPAKIVMVVAHDDAGLRPHSLTVVVCGRKAADAPTYHGEIVGLTGGGKPAHRGPEVPILERVEGLERAGVTAAQARQRRRIVEPSRRLVRGSERPRVARQQRRRPVGENERATDTKSHTVQEVTPRNATVQPEIAIAHAKWSSNRVIFPPNWGLRTGAAHGQLPHQFGGGNQPYAVAVRSTPAGCNDTLLGSHGALATRSGRDPRTNETSAISRVQHLALMSDSQVVRALW